MRTISMALCCIALAGGAAADEPKALSGTWTGTGAGVGKEDGWTDETADAVSLVIEDQRGAAFTGHQVVGGSEPSPFWGSLTPDGKTIYIADEDSLLVGTFSTDDQMDVCHLETGDDAEARCVVLKRAP